jgi:DNA-binding response OmpR family regulator
VLPELHFEGQRLHALRRHSGTAREYALMTIFIQNVGRVLSRSAIAETGNATPGDARPPAT